MTTMAPQQLTLALCPCGGDCIGDDTFANVVNLRDARLRYVTCQDLLHVPAPACQWRAHIAAHITAWDVFPDPPQPRATTAGETA